MNKSHLLSLQLLGMISACAAPAWTAVAEPAADDAAVRAAAADPAKSGGHPERRSPLIALPKFDAAAYHRNRAVYCAIVEPGRVYQSATPGTSVPQLLPVSPTGVTIPALGSTPLRVKAVADAPVTFTSEGGGAFSNGLSSITVQADKQGRAEATYTATDGTFAIAAILVGSPLVAGQVTFAVVIEER